MDAIGLPWIMPFHLFLWIIQIAMWPRLLDRPALLGDLVVALVVGEAAVKENDT